MPTLKHHPDDVGFAPIASYSSALCARVMGEYREMPGLILTLPQAARLFGLDLVECEHLLLSLVQDGQLRTDGHTYSLV